MGKFQKDPTLQMKIHQYLVCGRRTPTKQEPNPKIVAVRLFAKNEVLAKSKFWILMRKNNKFKRSQGEIVQINEIFEKNTRHIKTYGIVLRYQSRTSFHNVYKEFRDVTLNGAVSQMLMSMSGNHQARHDTIQIIRTAVLTKRDQLRRPKSFLYRNGKLKFPIIKTLPRPSEKRFASNFSAKRPNLFLG